MSGRGCVDRKAVAVLALIIGVAGAGPELAGALIHRIKLQGESDELGLGPQARGILFLEVPAHQAREMSGKCRDGVGLQGEEVPPKERSLIAGRQEPNPCNRRQGQRQNQDRGSQ